MYVRLVRVLRLHGRQCCGCGRGVIRNLNWNRSTRPLLHVALETRHQMFPMLTMRRVPSRTAKLVIRLCLFRTGHFISRRSLSHLRFWSVLCDKGGRTRRCPRAPRPRRRTSVWTGEILRHVGPVRIINRQSSSGISVDQGLCSTIGTLSRHVLDIRIGRFRITIFGLKRDRVLGLCLFLPSTPSNVSFTSETTTDTVIAFDTKASQ